VNLARQFLLIVCIGARILFAAPAGSIDPNFNIGAGPNGVLRNLQAADNNQVLVCGDFDRWDGIAVGGLVRLNADGSRDTTFNARVGREFDAYGAWVQPDKKILATVWMTELSGTTRENLIRFNADGSHDQTFTADVDDMVTDAVFLQDGRILIVGSFTKVDGVARKEIAILHDNGKLDATFAADPRLFLGPTDAHVLDDGRYLIAGASLPNTISGLLRMTPDAVIDLRFNLGSAGFFAERIFPFANGGFVLGSSTRPGRVLANDAVDTHYINGAGLGFPISAAMQADERLVVIGRNLKDATGNNSSMVRLLADGKIDPSFSTSLNAQQPSHVVIRSDGKIIFGGSISLSGAPAQNIVASVLANDDAAPAQISWHAQTLDAIHNGPVTLKAIRQGNLDLPAAANWTVTFPAEALQVSPASGSISFAAGQSVADVNVTFVSAPDANAEAQFVLSNPQGATLGAISTASLFVTNQTSAISVGFTDTSVVEPAGAVFLRLNRTGAISRPATVAWKLEGATNPSEDFSVSTGLVTFAAGFATANISFSTRDNTILQTNRRYTLTLAQAEDDAPIASPTSGNVEVIDDDMVDGKSVDGPVTDSIKLTDGGAIIMGQFTRVNGLPARNIARLDAAGDLVTTFQIPEVTGSIAKLYALADGKFLATGAFTSIGGVTRTNIARLHSDGSLDESFDSNFITQPSAALGLPDGSVLLNGSSVNPFNGIRNNTNMGAIVRLLPNGQKDTNFKTPSYVSGPVNLASAPNGQFYAFGSIAAWTNQLVGFETPPTPFRHGIIRFNADGALDPAFQVTFPTTNTTFGLRIPMPSGTPTKVALYPDGRLLVGGSSFKNINGREVVGPVRLSSTGELDLAFATNILNTLPPTGASNLFAFDLAPSGAIIGVGGPREAPRIHWLSADGVAEYLIPFPGVGPIPTVQAYADGTALITGSFESPTTGYRVAWFDANHEGASRSTIAITAVQHQGSETILTAYIRAAGSYNLQSSADLINWSDVEPFSLNLGSQTITTPSSDDEAARFYRFTY
jgi:uncharacterized delta-60 repeat protein